MATLDSTAQLTLLELAKRKDPSGDLATIVEILAQDNEILMDAPWIEANDTFSHTITRRTSLPAGTWRKLNSGVTTEASSTVKVVEGIGMLETYSEADKDLVDAAPNPRQFRSGEASAFLEGLSQEWAQTVFYGNATVTPEEFTGLATRMSSLGNMVAGGGGTGSDLTSIYIVQWGENKCHFVYPKNHSSIGIRHQDLGEVTLGDATNGYYQGYRDHFQLKCGLVVRDDRCIARYANIESAGSTSTFDEDYLIALLNKMPMSGAGAVMYCNHTIKTQMEIKLKDKTNVNFTTENGLGGVPVLKFRGLPVKKCDQILITESALT